MAGFPKKYVYTTGDPNGVSLPDGVGVAIKFGGGDGATLAQIQAYKAAHPNNPIVIWAATTIGVDYVSTLKNAVAAAQEIGASGFIAQGESPAEMNAAAAVGSSISIPKIIVTNGDTGVKWPPGWGIGFEYYANDPEKGLTPQNMTAFLKSILAQGATSVQITIGDYSGMSISMQQYQAALDYLKSQGIDVSSVSIYIWDGLSGDQQKGFLTALGVPVTGATPTGVSGTTTSQQSKDGAKPKPKPKPKPLAVIPPKPEPGAQLGIQHEKPLKDVASHGYKGETDPNLTYSYTDKQKKDNTLTFRPNGVVIQTKADGTSFVVWDPSKHNGQHWPGFDNQNIKDPYAGATINPEAHGSVAPGTPTPSGEATPAWHTNPGWKGLDDSTKAALKSINGINSSQVLEEREGANSNIIIFRMSDGTYKSLDITTGEVKGAGTWKNTQWNATGYGPTIKPDGTIGSSVSTSKSEKSGSSSNSSTNSDLDPAIQAAMQANKTPSGETTPAWHANPGWKNINEDVGSKMAKVSGLDSSQILETRPSKDGKSTIVRMADGTYKSYNIATGAVTGAGNWDNTKWNGTGYGPSIKPDGTISGSTPQASNQDPITTSSVTAPTSGGQNDQTATTGSITGLEVTPAPTHGGSCFPAGSLILTPDGSKLIEEIKLRDEVLTWNFDENRMQPTKVTDALAHHNRETVIIATDAGKITTTSEHPFWTGNEWTAAGRLNAGESKIRHQDGELYLISSIKDGPTVNVYNFHVTNPAHNYFVNGFLVHNMKMLD